MPTSRTTDFLSEIAGDGPIPVGKLAYFEARLRNNLYHFIIGKFLEREKRGELTKAKLARRIGYDPAQLSRTLGAPGNWTLNTISNLLIGIAAEELKPSSESLLNRAPRDLQEQKPAESDFIDIKAIPAGAASIANDNPPHPNEEERLAERASTSSRLNHGLHGGAHLQLETAYHAAAQ